MSLTMYFAPSAPPEIYLIKRQERTDIQARLTRPDRLMEAALSEQQELLRSYIFAQNHILMRRRPLLASDTVDRNTHCDGRRMNGETCCYREHRTRVKSMARLAYIMYQGSRDTTFAVGNDHCRWIRLQGKLRHGASEQRQRVENPHRISQSGRGAQAQPRCGEDGNETLTIYPCN
jgi:hypothetical protein